MLYTKNTITAMNVAWYAHCNQRDKGGLPYVFHSYHIAEQMNTEDEICVALLHDVIEDSCATKESLSNSFSDIVVNAVVALTRNQNEDYSDYIDRVIQNPLASKVKEADLIHNMNLDRILSRKKPDEEELKKILKRNEKYREALRRIRAARKD